jgi:hypothetical protein
VELLADTLHTLNLAHCARAVNARSHCTVQAHGKAREMPRTRNHSVPVPDWWSQLATRAAEGAKIHEIC